MNGVGSKAVASTGAIGLAAQLVSITLWAVGATPPQDIVLAIQGVVSAALAYAAVYFVPHIEPPAS